MYFQDSDDLHDATKFTEKTQPFLICAYSTSRTKGKFFIRIDDEIISLTDNFLKSFDILFKLHFVLNLHFSPDLDNFYDFLCIIYEIGQPRSVTDSLHIAFTNLIIE